MRNNYNNSNNNNLKKMKKIIQITLIISLLITLFLASCTSSIPPEKQCSVNQDCVPSKCCHADDAVNKANAPNCNDIFCTQQCKPGTLDCNQGKISCVKGECKALITS